MVNCRTLRTALLERLNDDFRTPEMFFTNQSFLAYILQYCKSYTDGVPPSSIFHHELVFCRIKNKNY